MQDKGSSSVPPAGGSYRCAIPLRWGDLDALNHINNTVYFRLFEEARVKLLYDLGLVLPSTRVGVLAHTSCDFLKPLMYPAVAVVTQVLKRVGRSSLEMDVVLEREDEPGLAYAKGRYVVVAADAASGLSVPWTEDERARLAAVLS